MSLFLTAFAGNAGTMIPILGNPHIAWQRD